MGLFQNLLETYDKCQRAAGIARNDSYGEKNENKTLLPIFHTTLKSEICVIINDKGDFLDAQRDNKEQTIIIPCTENSEGRSGKVTEENVNAHPLCDQIDYVSGLDEIKYNNYIKGLEKWKNFACGVPKIKLEALYTYISKKTIIIDLINKGVFKDDEFDSEEGNKNINFEKVRKIGVRFCIQISSDLKDKVWEDDDLRQSWIDYTRAQVVTDKNKDDYLFDYISGVRVFKVASQHPKKINLATPNSKLMSCNDTTGFTFRGRFENQDQAIIIDAEQSQKMHQVLKWLINNYGYNIDTQSIIVWAVDDNTDPGAIPYKDTYDLFGELKSKKTKEELISEAETKIFADYSKKLNNYFLGYGRESNITQHSRKICIAILDAATTGRIGLTFYRELNEKEYLENIVKWHEETSYYLIKQYYDKENKNSKKSFVYIGAPSFDDIIFAVYGNPRSQNDRDFQIFKRKMRKQLFECMFGNFPFPKNVVEKAATRASHPLSFIDKNSFSLGDWEKCLGISCALARKYIKQQKKEEIKMELEEKRNDRDYLYGRLLAIADKLENFALYKSGKNEGRATNAVRLMNAFSVKPYQTWAILYNQIMPYINQLNGANFYRSLIDEVMVLFKPGDYESNKPLSPLYLLGYSAQSRALSNKKEENNNVE